MRALLALFAGCLLALGCATSGSTDFREQAAAALDSPEAAVPIATEAVPIVTMASYPVLVGSSQLFAESAESARILTMQLDSKCDELPIDSSLDSKRTLGKGCPRPDGAPATWGAQ